MWFTFPPMGEPQRVDAPSAHVAVVRPLSRVAQRRCARPACPGPASATLRFDYARREAWLDALLETPDPQSYDLCATHVGRTHAPYGWRLRDRRSEDDRRTDAPPATPADLGGERTVAVLAAALRAVPDTVPENGADRMPRVTQIPRGGAGAAATLEVPDPRPSRAAAGRADGRVRAAEPDQRHRRRHGDDAASPVSDPSEDGASGKHAADAIAGGVGFAVDW